MKREKERGRERERRGGREGGRKKEEEGEREREGDYAHVETYNSELISNLISY